LTASCGGMRSPDPVSRILHVSAHDAMCYSERDCRSPLLGKLHRWRLCRAETCDLMRSTWVLCKQGQCIKGNTIVTSNTARRRSALSQVVTRNTDPLPQNARSSAPAVLRSCPFPRGVLARSFCVSAEQAPHIACARL